MPAQGIDDSAGQLVTGEQRAAGDMEQQAVGVDLHFMQVAFDQIQNGAHGDLPELLLKSPPHAAGTQVLSVPGLTGSAGCSSVAR
ncbi:hypothetical protein D3C78_1485520 [compost metagenome]